MMRKDICQLQTVDNIFCQFLLPVPNQKIKLKFQSGNNGIRLIFAQTVGGRGIIQKIGHKSERCFLIATEKKR